MLARWSTRMHCVEKGSACRSLLQERPDFMGGGNGGNWPKC